MSEEGFYEIKGENVEIIYQNNTERSLEYAIDNASENLICYNINGGIYHYDGNDFEEIFDSSIVYSVRPALKNSFIFRQSSDGILSYLYYDCASKEITEIPPEKITGRFFDTFFANGDSVLLSMQWQNPNNILYIYKAIDKFSDLKLINEIYDVGNGSKAIFKNFGNEGMLYTGDIISLMDDSLNFHPLEGIKGSYYNPEIIEKNGDLYFLAINKTSGRQLYRTTLYSYRQNQTIDPNINSLKIFPNPTNNKICLKNFTLGKNNFYELVNIDGKIMMKGELLSSEINVSELKPGIYFLRVHQNNKDSIGRFIIMK